MNLELNGTSGSRSLLVTITSGKVDLVLGRFVNLPFSQPNKVIFIEVKVDHLLCE